MTIDKAIEILETEKHLAERQPETGIYEALKLGIEALRQDAILKQVADWGLFIARLNNSDWMVGKGTHIYHLEITQDHYADPNLSISPNLGEAVAKAVEKLKPRR